MASFTVLASVLLLAGLLVHPAKAFWMDMCYGTCDRLYEVCRRGEDLRYRCMSRDAFLSQSAVDTGSGPSRCSSFFGSACIVRKRK